VGESAIMNTADSIQFGILFIALTALIIQILVQNNEAKKLDKRNLSKLSIFYFCQVNPRTELEIIKHFKATPAPKANELEIKKSIYEMLKDGTLRYRTNNTFKARRNTAKQEAEEQNES
jgi:hypothetical protein